MGTRRHLERCDRKRENLQTGRRRTIFYPDFRLISRFYGVLGSAGFLLLRFHMRPAGCFRASIRPAEQKLRRHFIVLPLCLLSSLDMLAHQIGLLEFWAQFDIALSLQIVDEQHASRIPAEIFNKMIVVINHR